MSEQRVIIQRVSWSDLFPWTLIFRTLAPATSLTVLVLALLGVLMCSMGWLMFETAIIGNEVADDPILSEIVERNRSPYRGVFDGITKRSESIEIFGIYFSGPRMVFSRYVDPFTRIFQDSLGARPFLYFACGITWMIGVWSLIGLMISRVALLKLTRNENLGLDDAFEYGLDHWLTSATAIFVPIIAIAGLCIPGFLIGLLMGYDIGVVVAGFFWIVILICSGLIGFLIVGLMFGFPLVIASVGCEGQNAFDAMTRSYAYVIQRPLHLAFYFLLTILFGGFCWTIVATLTNTVVELSFWSTSWGANIANPDRMDAIRIASIEGSPESDVLSNGKSLIGIWNALIKTIAAAFIYGLFWSMAGAVYLLLRQNVDETELDEIYLAEEKRSYQLPPLQSDENGIPVVQNPMPVSDAGDQEMTGADDNELPPHESDSGDSS
ncbi:MAG: hypothetical protein AAF623_06880 [Planctomycetota bacterium]